MIARLSDQRDGQMSVPEAAVWLKRLLVHMASMAEGDARRIRSTPDTAIHALRKRMKKLLALLRLARSSLSTEQFGSLKTSIRDLKRAVATQRDEQVMATLAHQVDEGRSGAHARKVVRRKKADVTAVTDILLVKLDAMVASLTDRLGKLRLYSLSWGLIGEAFTKTYKQGFKARHRCEKEDGIDHLHDWRKICKDHYYQSLALRDWLGHDRRLKRARRLASSLGRVHDLDLLLACETFKPDAETREKLESKRKKLVMRVFKKGARVYARTPDDMAREVRKRLPG